jgi:murein DD-endopeptidase MepM/ murein hydrolase activator NlpD
MAQKYYIGNIGSTGVSTGPHGHLYVRDLKANKYIDPATAKNLLTGFRVGQNEIPLITKDKTGALAFNPETGLSLTSGYGARERPTAGASSFHQGWDLAGPTGTQLKYISDGGQYTPKTNQGGFGNLGVFTTPDKRYEIGVGHLQSVGKEAGSPGGTSTGTVSSTPDESTADAAANKILAAIFGQKEKEPTLTEQLIGAAIEKRLTPQQSSQDFLTSYMTTPSVNPYDNKIINPSMLSLS